MNNEKNNGKGIFYGVIGVATLIVAIIGATFAYFTATQSAGNNVITGNAATVSFGLAVEKVVKPDEEKGGLIPMTDGMVEKAVTNASKKGACVDDTDAAVCQIYKITISNTGSAALFLDGYVNLTGGAASGATTAPTSMRWAQVFSTDGTTYALTGTPALATGATVSGEAMPAIAAPAFTADTSNVEIDATGTTGSYTYEGNTYAYINKNWMRKSGKDTTVTGENTTVKYDRTTDLSGNALVFNQRVESQGTATLYFVVWLTESGDNQTMDTSTGTNFFNGLVTFNSASGGEVSATFNGMTRKPATQG